MAADRTFTLIGNFTDNISPSLVKVHKSLNHVKRHIASVTKHTSALNDGFKELAKSSADFNSSLKGQAGELNASIAAIRNYRSELGKLRRSQSRVKFPPMPPPGSGNGGRGGDYGGGRGGGRSGGRSRGGYREDYGGGGVARDSSFVFSQVLGNQVAGLMTNAIVGGFQIGVGLMMKPFEYFQSALQERIADQQSDIKAAGGYFSLSKRQAGDKKFINTFEEAMEYTQMNNKYMADLAKALPGDTQQYVEVSKRLSDSIARTVLADPKKAIEYANTLRADPSRIGGPTEKITDMGPRGIRQTITELVGEITKKTVLAGLGGGAQGGVAGAYGLPGLSERLLTQDKVSLAQFRRYAAIFRDPMISDALERYIPQINATAGTSVERYQILKKMFDDILPPEVIRAFMRSTAGIIEAFKTTLLGPETGLFGLGRKIKNMGPKFDTYGNKVADSVEEGLSIFDMISDTFGNVMLSLMPLIDIIPTVFDPLRVIGESLMEMRVSSFAFLRAFERYKAGITLNTKKLDEEEKKKFEATGGVGARASFAAINNLFRAKGVYGYGPQALERFKKNAERIMSLSLDPGAMMSEFTEIFMSSQIAEDIGKQIGSVARIVLKQISDLLDQLTGVTDESRFLKGLKEGFGNEGKAAFVNIIRKVLEGLGVLLLKVVTEFPLETALIASVSLLMPALSAGLSSAIGIKIERFIDRGLPELMSRGGREGRGGLGAFFSSGRMDRTRRRVLRPVRNTGRGLYQGAQLMGAFGMDAIRARGGGRDIIRQRNILGGMVRNGAKISRYVPGGAVAGGALDMGLSLASGQSFGKAAAGAIGTVLGGVAGSAFGPVGTMIGMTAGGMLGDFIFSSFDPASIKQKEAAKIQYEAAQAQLRASNATNLTSRLGLPDPEVMYGSMKEFSQRLTVMGVEGRIATPLYQEYAQRNVALEALKTATRNLEVKERTLASSLLPKEDKERQLAPLREAVRAAGVRYEKEQKELLGKWMSLPTRVRDALQKNFETMPTDRLENEFAKKIREIKVQSIGRSGFPDPGVVKKINQWILRNPGKQLPEDLVNQARGVKPEWRGGLGDAVASELKHKPPGSNLVIANSSETVIPAAGGYGMVGFITVLRSGFGTTVIALSELRRNLAESFKLLNQTLIQNQAKNDKNFKSLEKKFTSPSLPGGLGGARAGGVDAFTPIAQQFGLSMTSGYRPGDSGWHGANRARDFSNGSGPTAQMMQFAQYMASTYGANLKELIYTPLGYSIKDGQIVSPYSQRGHYNHVHVAYGLGAGSPAFFTNRRDAIKWEKSMMPGGAKVSSITSNSSEGFGTTIHAPITIYQQPGQDSEELAQIVVARLGMAVQTISNHM